MNIKTFATLVAASLMTFVPSRAFGWGCSRSASGSGDRGGSYSHTSSTSGGYGSFSHSGSTPYTSPSGQSYSGSYSGEGVYGGGSAAWHGSYSGTNGSANYAGAATNHPSYYGGSTGYAGAAVYHPPTYYGAYGSSSTNCYAAGAFGAGVVTGAAVTTAPPVTNVYVAPAAGVYVAPSPYVVSAAPVVASPTPIGSTVTVLPPGYVAMNINNTEYYQVGTTYYQMRMGGNGAYFVVVPAP